MHSTFRHVEDKKNEENQRKMVCVHKQLPKARCYVR